MYIALKIHNCAIAQKTVSKLCVGVCITNMQDLFQIFLNLERTVEVMDWKTVQHFILAKIQVSID